MATFRIRAITADTQNVFTREYISAGDGRDMPRREIGDFVLNFEVSGAVSRVRLALDIVNVDDFNDAWTWIFIDQVSVEFDPRPGAP